MKVIRPFRRDHDPGRHGRRFCGRARGPFGFAPGASPWLKIGSGLHDDVEACFKS